MIVNESPYQFELRMLRQLNAFSIYLEKGLKYACQLYPKDKDFIEANQDKTLSEVKSKLIEKLESHYAGH